MHAHEGELSLQRQRYCITLAGLTLQISARSPRLKTETHVIIQIILISLAFSHLQRDQVQDAGYCVSKVKTCLPWENTAQLLLI